MVLLLEMPVDLLPLAGLVKMVQPVLERELGWAQVQLPVRQLELLVDLPKQ
jgi:hypothetical protein